MELMVQLFLPEPDGAVLPRVVEPSDSSKRIGLTRWVGESALLPCVAQGNPVPESTWFRIESPSGSLRQVLPSPRIKYHLEVLVLQRLLVEDSGVYVCIMNNTAGSQRIEVDVLVRSPLETRVDPAEQTVDLNRPAVFKCAVLGHPVKEISWYKDGRQLHRGNRWVTCMGDLIQNGEVYFEPPILFHTIMAILNVFFSSLTVAACSH
jgi:hypothetical protein